MIISMMLLLSLSHLILTDQILRKNVGENVTLSCLFEDESQFDQVSFFLIEKKR